MISIITSLYKSESHLKKFLMNVKKVHEELEKMNVPFEHLIIANDYSPEERRLIESSDLNLKVFSVSRESIYESWNRGIKASIYDIFTPWNVDDERYAVAIKDGIETMRSGYNATFFPFVYKRYINFLGIKILVKQILIDPPEYNQEYFKKTMSAGPFFMVNKKAFSQTGYFDSRYKISGDFDWWSRAAKKGISVKKTHTVGGIFFNDGKTLSGSRNKLQQIENLRVLNSL
jgi:hypothetical protein